MSLFYVIGLSFDKMHFTCNFVDIGVFNTLRNCVSRSSVEVIKFVQETSYEVQVH